MATLAVGMCEGASLQVRRDGTDVVVTWPRDDGGSVLQEASSLSPVPQWTQSALPVMDDGSDFGVRFHPTGIARYFRLITPPGASFTRLASSSPSDGDVGVAVTRETVLRFTRPLDPLVTPSLDQVHAEFGGRRLLSRLEASSDRRTLTLFYLENLPGNARIRVVINGDTLRDANGKAIDADEDGVPGGKRELVFDTLSLTPVVGTAVIGRVFASELSGGPGGGINRPLEGVTVVIDGLEETHRTVTDELGNFRLEPVPAGDFFVHIDGRTSPESHWPEGAYYPVVGKQWTAVPGREDNLAGGTGEIFLPHIAMGTLQHVSTTVDTPITFPETVLQAHPDLDGVMINVPANSLFQENGGRGGQVGMAPVPPDRLPGPLPAGLEFPLVITVQTDGPSNFDRPVPVRFPNLPDPKSGLKLAPGEKSALWSFNHDTGQWEIVGPMTVSSDGRYVESDPGYGILQPGWHGTLPGTTTGPNGDGPPPGTFPPGPCSNGPQQKILPIAEMTGEVSDDDATEAGTAAPFDRRHPMPLGGGIPVQSQLFFSDSGKYSITVRNIVEEDDGPSRPCAGRPLKIPLGVRIEIDGNEGDQRFFEIKGQKEFTLGPGQSQEVTFACLRMNTPDKLRAAKGNLLYGARVNIRFHADGKSYGKERLYLYRLFDVGDTNHNDRRIQFPNTAMGLKRELPLLARYPTAARPQLYVADESHFSVARDGGWVRFSPTAVGERLQTTINLITPTGGELAQRIRIEGAGRMQKWSIDRGSFGLAMAPALLNTSFPKVDRDIVDTQDKWDRFLDQLQEGIEQRLEPYSKGITLAAGGGNDTIRVSFQDQIHLDFLESSVLNLIRLFPNALHVSDQHPEGFTAWTEWREEEAIRVPGRQSLLSKRHGIHPLEARFRLSRMLNPSPGNSVYLYPPVGLRYWDFLMPEAFGDYYAVVASHEIAHAIGLHHLSNPNDTLNPILNEPAAICVFRASDAPVQVGLGIDEDETVTDHALDLLSVEDPANRAVCPSPSPQPAPTRNNGRTGETRPQSGEQPDSSHAIFQTTTGPLLWFYRESDPPEFLQSIDFDRVPVDGPGGSAKTLAIRAFNPGNEVARIGRVTVAGAPDAMVLPASPSDAVVAPGDSVSFLLRFDPVRPGRHTASLLVESNVSPVPFEIPMTGIGLSPNATPQLEIGNNNLGGHEISDEPLFVEQAAILHNYGTVPLLVTGIEVTDLEGAAQFGWRGLATAPSVTTPLPIAPGESIAIDLSFDAKLRGLQRGELRIATAGAQNPIVQPLVGTGIAPDNFVEYGGDFIAIELGSGTGAGLIRFKSDPAGRWERLLGANLPIVVSVFDPVSGLFSQQSTVTGSSGFSTRLSTPGFGASVAPDRDGDGLPDDVEFAMGTDPNERDTDRDGLDDFIETRLGLDAAKPSGTGIGVAFSLGLPGDAVDVWAGEDKVVVALGDAGVAVANAMGGLPPTLLALVDTPGNARRVAAAGTLIAVADDEGGLAIIDATRPADARIARQVTVGARVQSIAIAGSIGFAGLDDGRILAVDLATGAILGEAKANGGIHDLGASGRHLFAVTQDRVWAWTLEPNFLQATGNVPISGLLPEPITKLKRLFVGGGRAWVTSYLGYDAIDVSQPAAMRVLGVARSHGPASFKDLVPNGSGLGLAAVGVAPNPADGTHHVSLYDLGDDTRTDQFLTLIPTPGVAKSIALYRGRAFVAAGGAGLQVVDYLPADTARRSPTISISTGDSAASAVEGSRVRLFANARDDVQVVEVEFYVDGTLIGRDGNFPFEMSFVAPRRLANRPSVGVRARAFDAAGNFTWSSELRLDLVADTIAPRVAYIYPADGGAVEALDGIRLVFGEPLNPATLVAANFRMAGAGADGILGTADDVTEPFSEIRYEERTGSVTLFPRKGLPSGEYAMSAGTGVQDLAGNAVVSTVEWRFQIGTGLSSDYYFANGFTGPFKSQLDPGIDVSFPDGASRSIRWRGRLLVPGVGRYTNHLQSAGRGRIWIDRQLILENWVDHPSSEDATAIDLTAGEHEIQVEFQMPGSGDGMIRLEWSGPGMTRRRISATHLRPFVDSTPPLLLIPQSEPSFQNLLVRYSKPMDEVTAEDPTRYSLDRGARVLGAALQPNRTDVRLTTSRLDPGTLYRLSVRGVTDASAQHLPIEDNAAANFYTLETGPGWLRREVYLGAGPSANSPLSTLTSDPRYPYAPEMIDYVPSSEVPVNAVQQFFGTFFGSGQRLVGWITPAATANYQFWVEAGNEGDLLLSTDDSPDNLRPVAKTTQGNISRHLWQNGLTPALVRLEAGRRYFLEARHKFFGSDEHFAIGWSAFGLGNFVIEAEDYDHGGGNAVPVADVMPYLGGAYTNLPGIRGIDFNVRGFPDPTPSYRPFSSLLLFGSINDPGRATWTTRVDYAAGPMIGTNEWRNYSRTVPKGRYRVFARMRPSPDLETRYALARVTSGVGTTNQVMAALGEFRLPRIIGSSSWTMTALVEPASGQPVTLELDGRTTLRLSGVGSASLGLGLNFLVLVPESAADPRVPFWDAPPRSANGVIPADYLSTYREPDGANQTRWELFNLPGISSGSPTNLTTNPKYPDSPDRAALWTLIETANVGDRFGQQITGCITPPLTGDYRFHFASDDGGYLYLSTDDSPANARRIATEPVWNGSRDWSGLDRRNRDAPENRSGPIHLEAGRRYWFRELSVDAGLGDYLGFTWQLPGGLQPGRESPPPRFGSISTLAKPSVLAITQGPASTSAKAGETARFDVAFESLPPIQIHWLRNGTPIGNATNRTLRLPALTIADDGSRISVRIHSLKDTVTSLEATLNVIP